MVVVEPNETDFRQSRLGMVLTSLIWVSMFSNWLLSNVPRVNALFTKRLKRSSCAPFWYVNDPLPSFMMVNVEPGAFVEPELVMTANTSFAFWGGCNIFPALARMRRKIIVKSKMAMTDTPIQRRRFWDGFACKTGLLLNSNIDTPVAFLWSSTVLTIVTAQLVCARSVQQTET